MKSQIKIVISVFLLSVTMQIEAQNLLTRIQTSNYFTTGNEVYFVMSNKYNSSGLFSEIMNGIDTLEIITLDNGKPFNENAIVISKETFLAKSKLNSQFSQKVTVAVLLPNLALAHFNVFAKNYGVYKNNIFYQYNKIENAEAATFTVVSDGYNTLSKDVNSVYFKERRIEGANPKTFQVLQEDYSKDDKAVFKQDKHIKNADPNSFEVLSYTYQKDENHVWIMGKLSTIDIKSFKILNYTYPNINGYKIISLYATDKKRCVFKEK